MLGLLVPGILVLILDSLELLVILLSKSFSRYSLDNNVIPSIFKFARCPSS